MAEDPVPSGSVTATERSPDPSWFSSIPKAAFHSVEPVSVDSSYCTLESGVVATTSPGTKFVPVSVMNGSWLKKHSPTQNCARGLTFVRVIAEETLMVIAPDENVALPPVPEAVTVYVTVPLVAVGVNFAVPLQVIGALVTLPSLADTVQPLFALAIAVVRVRLLPATIVVAEGLTVPVGGGTEEVIAIAAVPDWVESSTDVALQLPFPAVVPAVNSPALVIVPPVAVQVTAELKLPVPATTAEHCDVAPVATEVGLAVTVTEVIVGGVTTTALTVIVTDLDFVESSVEVAVIVTCVADVGLPAVKITGVPEATFVDALSVPAFEGFMARFTVLVVPPSAVGVMLSVPAAGTVGDWAVMPTVMVGGGITVVLVPPQAVTRTATTESKAEAKKRFSIVFSLFPTSHNTSTVTSIRPAAAAPGFCGAHDLRHAHPDPA